MGYRPQRAPKVPTYDPFVRPNPLEFAAAQGQVVVKERPAPALHDLPSPDLTSTNPIAKRQPQQKFSPKESKSQDENNGFMNDPVPFTSSFASLQTEASRPERSEAKTQVWELFDLKSLRIVPPSSPSHVVLISQIPFQVQEDFE